MSGQPASRRGPGEADSLRRSGHSFPSLGSPAAIPRLGETARKRATGAGNVPASAFPSRLTVPCAAGGAATTFGSALLPPPFLILLPSLYLRRCRSFSVLPNSLFSLRQTPTPEALPPTPLPPHCLASPHCPMPSSLCHANLSLIVPSPRLRVLAPAPRCPHISSPRLIPPSPLVWVPSHHPSAIKMLRRKVAWRSWHSSALFRRTQASESPRTPSSETPPSSFTHTCAVPEYSHPCAPLARISILDLGVASAP